MLVCHTYAYLKQKYSLSYVQYNWLYYHWYYGEVAKILCFLFQVKVISVKRFQVGKGQFF